MSKEQRSHTMSRVKSRDTAPELTVRKALHRLGFRYRLHPAELPGRPDIVLPRYRLALFVNGCFWHGHNCRRGRQPTSNVDFWRAKIERNVKRDQEAVRALGDQGWQARVLWECQLTSDLELLIGELHKTQGPPIPSLGTTGTSN
jgi:DNA mismatch endonuclease (patch repair protein)